MARSKKKTPGHCDRNPTIKAKFNRALRSKLKNPDYKIANGNSYRKEYCSYNICDWKWLVWSQTDMEWFAGEPHKYASK